jgi:hypothetical protein
MANLFLKPNRHGQTRKEMVKRIKLIYEWILSPILVEEYKDSNHKS